MNISRRDFLEGLALAIAAPASAGAAISGQTDELNAVAHTLRVDPERWRHAVAEVDDDVEDLVVVGAGISGLTGAYLFQRHAGRPVRVLVLDAMDEVGGHAQRNEFVSGSGRRLIGYGGSQSLQSPSLFSPAVRTLLAEVGIEVERFKMEFHDAGWLARHGLTKRALFFDPDVWDRREMVVAASDEPTASWLPRTPLPVRAQADLLRLEAEGQHPWRGLSSAAACSRLARITYRDYLLRVWRADPALATYFSAATRAYFGVGIDATSALDAWATGSLPGFDSLNVSQGPDRRMSASGRLLKTSSDDYIYHFPDGNHAVARALLRAMRPAVVPGRGMDTLSDSQLDVSGLDDPTAAVRVRLRATAVAVRHLGPPDHAERAEVRYVDGRGRLRAVRARQVLLAAWHRSIGRLTDEISPEQRRALDDQVKVPLVYATILLSNWRAWRSAGIAAIETPGGFWDEVALDVPISIGAQRFPESPDEPILLHMAKVVVPGDGRDPRSQSRDGRALLLGWSFARFETEVRRVLEGALGGYGFDVERDIEAITINRWAHGYSYEYMRPWDRYWPAGTLPVLSARRGWGRVAIAGADSGAYAYAHSAIDQATRAIGELLPSAKLPRWSSFPGPEPKSIGL